MNSEEFSFERETFASLSPSGSRFLRSVFRVLGDQKAACYSGGFLVCDVLSHFNHVLAFFFDTEPTVRLRISFIFLMSWI